VLLGCPSSLPSASQVVSSPHALDPPELGTGSWTPRPLHEDPNLAEQHPPAPVMGPKISTQCFHCLVVVSFCACVHGCAGRRCESTPQQCNMHCAKGEQALHVKLYWSMASAYNPLVFSAAKQLKLM